MNASSLSRVLRRGPNGVYRVAGAIPEARFAALCRRFGLRGMDVCCRSPCTKRSLMEAFARDLELPDYFGANWDALFDCLTDLEWRPARGYVIRLHGLDDFARRSPGDLRALLDVLLDAAASWAEEAVPFYVLVEDRTALADSGLAHITPS